MTFPHLRVWHILPFTPAALLAIVLAGCGSEEGVKKTEVPKTTDTGKRADAAAGEYRMLGAMFPAEDPSWFFKFSGPSDEIAKDEAGFDELIKSVKIAGDQIDFTPPQGWKKGPGRGTFVFATVAPPAGKSEVTITQSKGGVEGNLQRWMGQIGLRPTPDALAQYTKTIDAAGGLKGLRVDLKGPNDPSTKRGGPMMPAGHP